MSKNVLIVMCGLPASGKSTYSEWLAESGVFKRVCPDSIRGWLYGDESIQGNGKQVFEYAYNDIKQYGSMGKNVVFDATNIDRNRRRELVKEMRPYFDIIICKWFSIPLRICKLRNEQRERKVPYEVLESMDRRFAIPNLDDGFDIIEEIKNY